MAPRPFSFFSLLRSRPFLLASIALVLLTLVMASLPLTGVLGFEFNLFFGVFASIIASHFALASVRLRERTPQGPGFAGTAWRIWLAAILLSALPLALISLNALRIPNCNFSYGLSLFAILPCVTITFGVAVGICLAGIDRPLWPAILSYLLPLLNIGWSIWRGLIHPPIYAYSPYFGFFPGTIYDEVREISTSLLAFQIGTLSLSLLLLSACALIAGKDGLYGKTNFSWRLPALRRDPHALDGRLIWTRQWESALGSIALLLLSATATGYLHLKRHTLHIRHTGESIQQHLKGRLESPHFVIHYDIDSVTPVQLERIKRDHEFRYHQLVRFFGHRPKFKIRSYLFRDATQKSKLMGAAHTMIARPWAYEFYIHGAYFPHRVLKHEMAHVFSAAFGAGPLKLSARYQLLFNAALIEGVAVAADWDSGELTPHQWSRAMLALKIAPDPAEILGPTGFFRHASSRSYTIAGSFSRYLIQSYGIKPYKRAYGRAQFQKVYGKSLRTLSAQWRAHIQKIPLNERERQIAAARFRRHRSIFARVCPHVIASMRNRVARLRSSQQFVRATSLQKQICRLSPRPYNHMRLLQIYYQGKRYQRTLSFSRQLLRSYNAKQYPQLNLALLRLHALALFRRNKAKQARQIFANLLKRPSSLYLQRTLYVRHHALQHATLSKTIMDYLDQASTASLLRLQAASFQFPQDPVLAYLLGRRYYFASQYKLALPLLRKAYRSVSYLPLRAEALRLLARASFAKGDYMHASQLFRVLSTLPLPKGLQNNARDWQQRALWEFKTYKTPPSPNMP